MKFFIRTLGCPKNEVDTQSMARRLMAADHQPAADEREADLLIVNTCGFIDKARAESIAAIQKTIEGRRPGQKVIAAGCLVQLRAEELRRDLPEVDAFLGAREWSHVAEVVARLEGNGLRPRRDGEAVELRTSPTPAASLPLYPAQLYPTAQARHTAYLKIADGCSAPCAFCIIPKIKGPWQSKPIDQVVAEARALVDAGAREVILVAQDLTAYGYDQGRRDVLADLVEAIGEAVPDLPWLRLMYAFPSRVTERLIRVMAERPQVCRYLDLPLQHAHPETLRRMVRPSNVDTTRNLIGRLREAIPDIALRTGFIVGFPGESEVEFRALLDFVEEMEFDRVGVFTYSPEPGTAAAELSRQLPTGVKRRRYERLMATQQVVSWRKNKRFVGRTLDVLVEGVAEVAVAGRGRDKRRAPSEVHLVGRSYRDAPEVDGLVICRGEATIGDLVPVRITEALAYDLVGDVVGQV